MLTKLWGGWSLPDLNPSNRVIVLDIGSENGFLQGGRLIYKANTTTGDYHSQMNFVNFTKWIRERVLHSLTPNSVVVIDNAPYHGEQEDKVPKSLPLRRLWLVVERWKRVRWKINKKNRTVWSHLKTEATK